jgi:hypothetical protein
MVSRLPLPSVCGDPSFGCRRVCLFGLVSHTTFMNSQKSRLFSHRLGLGEVPAFADICAVRFLFTILSIWSYSSKEGVAGGQVSNMPLA